MNRLAIFSFLGSLCGLAILIVMPRLTAGFHEWNGQSAIIYIAAIISTVIGFLSLGYWCGKYSYENEEKEQSKAENR